MKLIGTSDILHRYGLDRMQVHRLIKAGDWPAPAGETGGGKLWHERDVEARIERLQREGRLVEQGDRLVLVRKKSRTTDSGVDQTALINSHYWRSKHHGAG